MRGLMLNKIGQPEDLVLEEIPSPTYHHQEL